MAKKPNDNPSEEKRYVPKKETTQKKKETKAKPKKKAEIVLVKANTLIISLDGHNTTLPRTDDNRDLKIGDFVLI